MKGWIKCGLAGALILVASFWGDSVRAAGMALERDAAVPGQLVGQAAALQTDTNLLPLRALPSVVAGRGT
ncbi:MULTISPECIES: hypothetical protein [Aeromonas]|uniref:hypothetical protein n=1 Tax=Aeromonas TaxID=642 RepID=UPI001F38F265|nr:MULTISPECIES: hypothetical protein [Aeromonas]BDC85426.1 hypothetical protein NUITMVA2_07830 [Aeromonas caviae]